MGTYLNKIGLLKYNNSTYKPVGEPEYYSVRDPHLVSSDPNVNFFAYPWKSDQHWDYKNYGKGWYYNGKNQIAYTFNFKPSLSSYYPTDQNFVEGGFVYNVVPIHQVLLSGEDLRNRLTQATATKNLMEYPQRLYVFEDTSGHLYKVKWNNDYRAEYEQGNNEQNQETDFHSTYDVLIDGEEYPIILSGNLPHLDIDFSSSGWMRDFETHTGLDFYNEFQRTIDQNSVIKGEYYYDGAYECFYKKDPQDGKFYESGYVGTRDQVGNVTQLQKSIRFAPSAQAERDGLAWISDGGEKYASYTVSTNDGLSTYYYHLSGTVWIYAGTESQLTVTLIPLYTYTIWSPDQQPWYQKKSCPIWTDGTNEYVSYSLKTYLTGCYFVSGGAKIYGTMSGFPYLSQGSVNDIYSNELRFEVKSPNISGLENQDDLQDNIVEGLFHNIPGTDCITGICTTKMYFLDDKYVYMRGMVKGKIDIQNGITNDIIDPSTVIKKLRVTDLQGTLKNVSNLPDEIKYGLDHYYAWGWLYGVDNITYKNVWYKNEISGQLSSITGSRFVDLNNITNDTYIGVLSTSITTNDGTDDIVNILTGNFTKEPKSNIITGYMEGIIQPYSIHMKGYLTGFYNIVYNKVKPLQLSGTLFNKSQIGSELRQILDIKYANTLGRKQLTYPHSLNGQKLNWSTKNYDPYNKPYMLQSWKIIEYKVSDREIDYQNYIAPQNAVDLNTYIADKSTLKEYYKSKILKSKEELIEKSTWSSEWIDTYYVWWDKMENGDFAIRCGKEFIPIDSETTWDGLLFNGLNDAQMYVKHICSVSNLKLKEYDTSVPYITSYILDSSDQEIK